MVLPGQYLERPALIARTAQDGDVDGITLEGLYHRGQRAPGLVVCSPHPRLGGSMDSPVVAELAWAVTRRGHASLRFNYQGVGASGGEISALTTDETRPTALSLAALEAEVADAKSAIRHLSECTDHGRIAIAGYSFGAAVALRVALEDPKIHSLILVAPPTALFDFEALKRFDRPLFVIAGQLDAWVDRPTVSGLVQAAADGHFDVIVGSDHVFTRGLTELGKRIADWLERRQS